MLTSLVVTVIGPDRPGLVSLVSDRGRAHGASWAESRMASLAGQFAGIVRFEVDDEQVEALAAALAELESTGLKVVIARGKAPAGRADDHLVKLGLVGQDRPGIVRDISRVLADSAVSIEELNTTIVSGAMSGENLFEIDALLRVPRDIPTDKLRSVLESLANELMVDITVADSSARHVVAPGC
jgi:glycine cleavage system regulatory protein